MQLNPPGVVLDTNVVLDWLVFQNPEGQSLFRAIESGQVRWLITAAMGDEFRHVLGRGVGAAWAPDLPKIMESLRLLSSEVPNPNPQGPSGTLRCSDPDDQKFVDLALRQARWLVSRDRAVLKLARRAERLGVRFIPPALWMPE